MSRPRSFHLSALALAAAIAPLTGALTSPVSAAGNSAIVDAVVTPGNVHVQSTKGLSRVTVVLCDGVTVVADDWDEDQKNGDVTVNGIVQAVFIHSGNNTTSAAQALLALLAGADAVKGNSTGAIALHDEDACDEPTTSSSSTTTTTTTTSTTVTTGSSPTTTTTVSDSTTTTTTTPDGSTTTTTTAAPDSSTTTTTAAGAGTTTTTVIPTTVLGVTLEKPGDPAAAVSPAGLARTGTGRAMFLLTLAAGLIASGTALLSVFRRRRAMSASSPG